MAAVGRERAESPRPRGGLWLAGWERAEWKRESALGGRGAMDGSGGRGERKRGSGRQRAVCNCVSVFEFIGF